MWKLLVLNFIHIAYINVINALRIRYYSHIFTRYEQKIAKILRKNTRMIIRRENDGLDDRSI